MPCYVTDIDVSRTADTSMLVKLLLLWMQAVQWMTRVLWQAMSILNETRLCHPPCTPQQHPNAPPHLTPLPLTSLMPPLPTAQHLQHNKPQLECPSFLQRPQCSFRPLQQMWQPLTKLLRQLLLVPAATWSMLCQVPQHQRVTHQLSLNPRKLVSMHHQLQLELPVVVSRAA